VQGFFLCENLRKGGEIMVLPKKAKAVAELKEKFSTSELVVLTDYRGLTVAEVTSLRKQLRPLGVEYSVSKNTLARFAAEQAGIENATPLLVGPMAIAFSHGDSAKVAKVMNDYAKGSKILKIKGALLQGKVISTDQLTALATLPPREVLLARVMGGMQSPMVGIVSVMNGPLQGFMRVLQARQQQLEAQS
jgi:large subunit ribosomal protein L10